MSDVKVLREGDQADIEALLLGRTVKKVDGDRLLLDDGATVQAVGNDGGCACWSGCYDLTELNGTDNIITHVEFDYHPTWDYEYDMPTEAQKCDPAQRRGTGHYRIFVFAENRKINLMRFDGTDGNGHYGTGFHLLVRPAEAVRDE